MSIAEMIERISINPAVCHGKPCIKGTRIMVDNVLSLLEGGYNFDRIIQNYPALVEEDIKAAIEYARSVVNDEDVILL